MSTNYSPDALAPAIITGPTISTDDLQWALDAFHDPARKGYQTARNYYDGKHELTFASEKLSTTFGRLFKAFADNLMPTVCETVKDRLKLDGFVIPGGEGKDPIQQPEIDEIWRRNRLLVRANQVHLDSLIEGDAYVIVWPNAKDDDFPTFYPNRAGAVVVDYDDEQPGYITRAAKTWDMGGKSGDSRYYRLTLYFRDRIEKYVTQNKVHGLPEKAQAFTQYRDDAAPWPIDNPYDKVPVFHFGNRVSIGMLGCSELKEAIPVQDALNKSVADMLIAGEFYAVPQRWAIGLEDELTETIAAQRYPLKSGGVWGTTSEKARFGEFSAADISKFITVSETFRKEVARVSRTPLHFFSLEGEMPSGESMKTAEGPLTAKVEDRQANWGGVWADAMRFALRISAAGEFEPEPKWRNTTPRDETDEVSRAASKVKDLQIPYEQVWRELGYTEKQIEQFAAERLKRQEEQVALMQAKAGLRLSAMSKNKKKANGDSEVLQ